MEFQIEFKVADAVKKMQKVVDKLQVMQPFFDDAEKYFRMRTKEQFETQGGFLGTKWAGLKQSSIKGRQRSGYAGAILNRTGNLKGSFEVTQRSNLHIVWSSKVPYYQYHQKGTSKMVQRQMIGYNDQAREDLKKLLDLYLKEATNA